MSGAWAFSLVYNEAPLIQYWVRHYLSFCDKAILYVDIDTTDGTEELARAEGADVRPWDGHGVGLDDMLFASFASDAYREAIGQTDWVIWVDADELLYHPTITEHLQAGLEKKMSFLNTDYYVMVADRLPTHPGQIYDDPDFRNGIFVQRNAKTAIFNPNQVSVTWGVGKHGGNGSSYPTEDLSADPIQILHYRWLGAEYLQARDARNYARMSAHNKASGFGIHVHPGFHGPYTDAWAGTPPSSARQVVFPTVPRSFPEDLVQP